MSVAATDQADPALNRAISDAMVELYAIFYQHDRTTATTYINDNVVVCLLENILTTGEDTLIADGARGGEVIDGRVAFQTKSEDEFTATIERLTHRANRSEAERLRALLTGLPDAQHEVITLAFYGELTHTEIATALDLPTGTVKGRMRLGLHKLRAGIEKKVA